MEGAIQDGKLVIRKHSCVFCAQPGEPLYEEDAAIKFCHRCGDRADMMLDVCMPCAKIMGDAPFGGMHEICRHSEPCLDCKKLEEGWMPRSKQPMCVACDDLYVPWIDGADEDMCGVCVIFLRKMKRFVRFEPPERQTEAVIDWIKDTRLARTGAKAAAATT